jgi:hypothetical protein
VEQPAPVKFGGGKGLKTDVKNVAQTRWLNFDQWQSAILSSNEE